MPFIDLAIHVHGKNYLTYTENQVRVHVFLAMAIEGFHHARTSIFFHYMANMLV